MVFKVILKNRIKQLRNSAGSRMKKTEMYTPPLQQAGTTSLAFHPKAQRLHDYTWQVFWLICPLSYLPIAL
jgi:hypothetical protein